MRRLDTAYRVLPGALLAYALLFALLAVDLMVRIWDWRVRFDAPVVVAALLLFEGMRSVIAVAGVGTALYVLTKARQATALLWLAYATAFTTIAWMEVTAFTAFPGAVQERVAMALIGAGTPRWLLQMLFGQWQWAAWLALAGFVLVSATWLPLTPADVRASGGRDRTGALRSVAVAGTDVGAVLRGWTATLLAAGWLSARHVWPGAIGAAMVHTTARLMLTGVARMLADGAAIVLAGAAVAVCVTLFRAAWHTADAVERRSLLWLRRAALSALGLFGVSAVTGLVGGGGVVGTTAVLLAPAAAFFCLARAAADVESAQTKESARLRTR